MARMEAVVLVVAMTVTGATGVEMVVRERERAEMVAPTVAEDLVVVWVEVLEAVKPAVSAVGRKAAGREKVAGEAAAELEAQAMVA